MNQLNPSALFANPADYLYRPGDIFLGALDSGHEIGITTERHAIAVAGSRTGKGAAVIIPNLLRWPENILCVDPSGENVAATWRQLQEAGKKVVLLDPFHEAEKLGVPASLRQSLNLFDAIDVNSQTVREDIRAIADGSVVRYKADDGTWDNGAVSVIAGFIAYVMATEPPERRNLSRVRFLLTLAPETRAKVFEEMSGIEGYGNLCRTAAAIGLSDSKKNQEFVSGALDHTEWIDSVPMGPLLAGTTFNLAELKTGNVAVFLVLPHDYIEEHKRFLRLFVRAALNVMTKGGKGGKKCLFLLDEFFSLGYVDELVKAAGALPKYGVHLFPLLQDIGQLQKVYGQHGASTFFANSDAAIFFGISGTDKLTLGSVSAACGKDGYGQPLLSPGRVLQAVGKGNLETNARSKERLARSMIVFAKAGDILQVRLTPEAFQAPPPVEKLQDTKGPQYVLEKAPPWPGLEGGHVCLILLGTLFGSAFLSRLIMRAFDAPAWVFVLVAGGVFLVLRKLTMAIVAERWKKANGFEHGYKKTTVGSTLPEMETTN